LNTKLICIYYSWQAFTRSLIAKLSIKVDLVDSEKAVSF